MGHVSYRSGGGGGRALISVLDQQAVHWRFMMRSRTERPSDKGILIGRTNARANVHRLLEMLEGRQLLSGGLPDLSFGSGGKVLTPFVGSRIDQPADVAVQSDGKFIVAGTSTDRTEDDFAL